MRHPHHVLCEKIPAYHRWHQHPRHAHHHWLALMFTFLIGTQAIAGLWQQTLEEVDSAGIFAVSRAQAAAPAGFVKRQGAGLVDGAGNPIHLRGTNFTGYFSFDTACNWYTEGYERQKYPSPDTHRPVVFSPKTGQCQNPPDELYNDKNYRDVKDIGFNVIRFPLLYRMFEDNCAGCPGNYKAEGWAYLDQHIALAKSKGVYLMLDMHVPQGGFGDAGFAGNGGGGGKDLWTVGGNAQIRFKNLWKAIAGRYKNETIIAGYDIVNEPHPISSKIGATWLDDVQAWKDLANATIADIRSVDPNHLIVVENVNWIDAHNPGGDGNWSLDVVKNFQIIVNDTNVMYDWHLYMPEEYALFGNVTSYPGGNVVSLSGGTKKFDINYVREQADIIRNQGSWAAYPVNVGEWGSAQIFAQGVSGGTAYIGDMVTAFGEKGIHWDHYAMPQLYAGDNLNGSLIPARACVFQKYFGTGTCAGGGPLPGPGANQPPNKPVVTHILTMPPLF